MYDPARERENLESPTFGYQWQLQRPVEVEYRFARGLSAIEDACACYFCGLDEGGRLLAEFGLRLLREANLETKSPLNRGHGFQCLALAHWLLTGEDDQQSLERSSREYQASDGESLRPDGHVLDSYLPYHLLAGACEYVCKRFEKFAKSKVPENLSSVRTSRVAAYVWARYKLGRDYSREQAEVAVRSFLDKALGESLLGRGHYTDAAIWLKILYWNDAADRPSPRDVLRKAYDHMPDVTR